MQRSLLRWRGQALCLSPMSCRAPALLQRAQAMYGYEPPFFCRKSSGVPNAQEYVPEGGIKLGATTRKFVEQEVRFGPNNYHPLDVVVAKAEGCYMTDVEGKQYLDFLAAYSSVNQGHNHPRIVAALVRQAQKLGLTSRAFRNDQFPPLLEKICTMTGFDRCLMMNSGAEAVETSIKAARKWGYEVKGIPDNQAEIIVFEGNFHGRTTTIVGFSSDPTSRTHFGPYSPGFIAVPFGDVHAAAAAITPRTCMILVEPIQGEGGVIVPPKGFLKQLRALCDQHHVLLVCDEIQSGFGRCGKLFAFEHEGIRPDGVTVGKALSGGMYPVSAFLARDALMSVFTPGSHGSTFGGNPLACAVASAALSVLEDEGLVARSAEVGAHLAARLKELQTRSRLVKETRCVGLWAGVDLEERYGGARHAVLKLQQRGLLCKDTHGNTLRLAPPLVITKEQVDWAIVQIAAVIEERAKELGE